MSVDTISEQISEFVLGLRYEEIPERVKNHVKLLMLDSFGCALLSADEEHAKCVRKAIEKMPNEPEATLWGTTEKLSVENAVLYNGCLVHGQDYDDTHAASIVHPSSSVLTAAMALGEKYGANGEDLMTAMVAAYEVILRLGNACKGKMHTHFFHPTGIFAPFAAICIAGRLEGVDKKTMVSAIGLAGNFAASTMQFSVDGTWSKKLHPGWGVHTGLYALRFAKEGFIGSPQIFEGSQGLFMSHIGIVEYLKPTFADLGQNWLTCEVAFKFYPVCHMMHSHLDVLQQLIKENTIRAEDIESITAILYPRAADIVGLPPEKKRRPENDYLMRFSIQYCLAVAAVKGRLSATDINMSNMEKTEILEMIDRVQVVEDSAAEVEGHFPGAVRIRLKDGHEFAREQRFEVGSAENPVKREHVLRKYDVNTEEILPVEQARRFAEVVNHFEMLPDMKEIFSLLKIEG